MTEILVPFSTFKRLVRAGRQNGPIFESKQTVLTSMGATTVLAYKPNPTRVFSKKNGWIFNSVPFKRRGYSGISSHEEKVCEAEEIVEEFIADLEAFTPEGLTQIRDAIDQILKEG